jgi:elongation factor Ts
VPEWWTAKALVEADGDFDKAIETLEKRTKVAANRSDRESTEAAIALSNADKTAGVSSL